MFFCCCIFYVLGFGLFLGLVIVFFFFWGVGGLGLSFEFEFDFDGNIFFGFSVDFGFVLVEVLGIFLV